MYIYIFFWNVIVYDILQITFPNISIGYILFKTMTYTYTFFLMIRINKSLNIKGNAKYVSTSAMFS